jgi:hypothetical protein
LPLLSISHHLAPSRTISHHLAPSRTISHHLAPSRTISQGEIDLGENHICNHICNHIYNHVCNHISQGEIDLGENQLGGTPPIRLCRKLREVHLQRCGISSFTAEEIAELMLLQARHHRHVTAV